MFFVRGSSVQILKAATLKRFSVCPCWSPILLKLQNSIGGVFQCIFNKISEDVFYKTTMNWYFGTKKGRCKYWSSIVLFESGIKQSSYFLIFVTSFCSVSLSGGYFKECLWPRKSSKNIAFVGKERDFFLRNQEVFCINVSW